MWLKIERWSWLAGILSVVVAAVAYVYPREADKTDPAAKKREEPASAPPTIQQSAGDGSVQVGTVGGNVTITMQADPMPAKVHSTLAKQLPKIFSELGPGASLARMRGLLGQPYAQGNAMAGLARILDNADQFFGTQGSGKKIMDQRKQFSYRFEDAYVQIRSEDGSSVSELIVVTRDPASPSKFEVRDTGVVIGKSRLSELLKLGEVENDQSSKHYLDYIYTYGAAPGAYLHYFYGSTEMFNVPAPRADGLVNFVAITAKKPKWLYFDWAHFQ